MGEVLGEVVGVPCPAGPWDWRCRFSLDSPSILPEFCFDSPSLDSPSFPFLPFVQEHFGPGSVKAPCTKRFYGQAGAPGAAGRKKNTPDQADFGRTVEKFLFGVYLRFSYGAELGEMGFSLFLEFHRQKKPLGFSPSSSDFSKAEPKSGTAARAPCEH